VDEPSPAPLLPIASRVLVALGGVAVVAAWSLHGRWATERAREGLRAALLDDLVRVGSVRVADPDEVAVADVALLDPVTGDVAVHVDELRVEMDGAWLDLLDARPVRVRGRGARVSAALVPDGERDEIVVARAVTQLFRRLPDGRQGAMPPIEVEDVQFRVASPGMPLETIEGCTVGARLDGERLVLRIAVGDEEGTLRLDFTGDGLVRLDAVDARVTPTRGALVPGAGTFLAHLLHPRGRLDLSLEPGPDGTPAGQGRLSDATLTLEDVPFPLERCDLPFQVAGGGVTVPRGTALVDGEDVAIGLDCSADHYVVDVDVPEAEFRSRHVDLLPIEWSDRWAVAEDGGNLELSLTFARERGGPPRVSGRGGVWIRDLRVTPYGVPLHDLVGSFSFVGDRLELDEVSARCASGEARGSCWLELSERRLHADLSVRDVDVRALSEALGRPRPVSGWLEGRVAYTGVLGDPDTGAGEGRFSIRGGNLWSAPLFERVLQVLQLTAPGPRERHRVDSVFEIAGRSYRVHEFRLRSDTLSLVGDGRLHSDGELDLELVLFSFPIGPLGDLIDYLQEKLVGKVEVGGTLEDPVVTVVPVELVSGLLETLLRPITIWFEEDETEREER